MTRYAVLGVFVLLLAVGIFARFMPRAADITHTEAAIVLRETGFDPDEITIRKGTAVVFSTSAANLFWPASNVHPSHSIYPEFDPKRPIQPGETWTFVFDKVGDWRFHDHVRSYFTGTIHVVD